MANGRPASCFHHLRKYESDSTLLQRHICVRRLTRPKYPPVLTLVFAFAEVVHARFESYRWRWDDCKIVSFALPFISPEAPPLATALNSLPR